MKSSWLAAYTCLLASAYILTQEYLKVVLLLSVLVGERELAYMTLHFDIQIAISENLLVFLRTGRQQGSHPLSAP